MYMHVYTCITCIYSCSNLFSAHFESQSVHSVPTQPVPRAEVVTEGMPQVVTVPNGLHHGHDPLEPAVHERSGTRHHVGPAPVPVVSLLLVAAIESVVEIDEVELVDGILRGLSPFNTLCRCGLASEIGTDELNGLTGGGD